MALSSRLLCHSKVLFPSIFPTKKKQLQMQIEEEEDDDDDDDDDDDVR